MGTLREDQCVFMTTFHWILPRRRNIEDKNW